MRKGPLLLCLAQARAAAPTHGGPLRSPLPVTPAPAAPATKSFWCCKSKEVPLHQVKRTYAENRLVDKKSRFTTRQRVRDDGVTSNLYLLRLHPGTEVHSYEIIATRRLLPGDPDAPPPAPKGRSPLKKKKAAADNAMIRRVDATRAWRVVQRFMRRHFPGAPPHVCVRQTLYAAGPLPAAALTLPRDALDYGWDACQLRWVGKVAAAQLPADELQEFANKIALCAIREHGAERGGDYSVVREATGKMVATDGGLSISGLRVFRGTIARVVFIDASGAIGESGEAAGAMNEAVDKAADKAMDVPDSAVLATLQAGSHEKPLRFFVREFVREFEYKNTMVQSYRIEDASGVILASLWKATEEAKLTAGMVYEATNFRVRIFENRGDMRLVEMVVGEAIITPLVKDTDPVTGTAVAAAAPPSSSSLTSSTGQMGNNNGKVMEAAQQSNKDAKQKKKKKKSEDNEAQADTSDQVNQGNKTDAKKMPGELALKIDTKCTVAAEQSLWAEVKQHFGSGPYDAAVEANILRAVQGTPVIAAHTLRQGIVRLVRFNISADAVAMDMDLQRHAHDIERGQPFALLQDGLLLPLQALHCCYDPRMRAWQDVTVTACSLLPAPRLLVLDAFRRALQGGLRRWGLALSERPCASRELALLPAPQRISSSSSSSPSTSVSSVPSSSTSTPAAFPSPVAVVAIAAPHADAAERSRVSLTAQSLAAALRSGALVATVADERAAVSFVAERLAANNNNNNNNNNAAVVFVSADRDSRPARWAIAECLVRGVLPIFLPPCASPKRHALLAQNARLRLRGCFSADPLRGIDIAREVPALCGRRVLVVGIDACHTTTFSTGSVVGLLLLCTQQQQQRSRLLPVFWRHEARGQEVGQVAAHFGEVVQRAVQSCGALDEVVVFQDGDVHSEVERMRAHVPSGCGLTFMCLHKRTNIRFVHMNQETKNNNNNNNNNNKGSAAAQPGASNVVKGAVVQALTPVAPSGDAALMSFYLQNHDCNMSTARTVQYTVHAVSPTLDVADVQQLSHVLSHVMATQATKLPMPARCAHKLASVAERLLDAAPPLTYDMIPAPLNERLWFM